MIQPASFEPGDARQARTVRLHRLVGQHITTIMPLAECEAKVGALIALIEAAAHSRNSAHSPKRFGCTLIE